MNYNYSMSPRKSKPITYQLANILRHDLTPPEARLWSYLRGHRFENVQFRRQHPIGKYIVDFCAPRKKLIIELDGSQHIDHQENDVERRGFFIHRGYTILRFWNHEISNDIDSVLLTIEQALAKNENA